jgi:hypothetical protein
VEQTKVERGSSRDDDQKALNKPVSGGQLHCHVEIGVCDLEKAVERTIHSAEPMPLRNLVNSAQTQASVLRANQNEATVFEER